jgi:hypothetical protein
VLILDDLPILLRKVEDLKEQKNQAKGARDQLLKRLKKEFGVSTLKEAKALLEKAKDKELAVAKEYTEVKKRFLKKWRKVL